MTARVIRLLLILSICMVAWSVAAVEYEERDWSSARLEGDTAREADLPDWARIGELLFTRMDGGAIEVRKASKTDWGIMFTPEEYDILSKAYTEHADRIVAAMADAGMNACWVTWSNGHSWTTEAGQRADIARFIEKCNARGIHVMAYICQSTIFWEDVFLYEPKAVNWFIKNPDGTPYQLYSRNPHRYAADISNPQWQALQKRRIAAAVDAGCEAFFFDNVVRKFSPWEYAAYYREIRRFIHEELGRPDIPISLNPHLLPQTQYLHDFCEMIFSESGSEPGVWEDTGWEISNVRKLRYLQGSHPSWKPIYYQHGALHAKTRETRALPPKSEALSIAEGAALGATYTRLWEGTPLRGLVRQDAEVMATYDVIRRYNRFLRENKRLYLGARPVAETVVLVPSHGWPLEWSWPSGSHTAAMFIDRLSMNSLPYAVRTSGRVDVADLARFKLMILADWPEPESAEMELIRRYKRGGGRILAAGGPNRVKELADSYVPADELDQVAHGDPGSWERFAEHYAQVGPPSPLTLTGAEHCTGNLTRVESSGTIVLHLLNYSPRSAEDVGVRLDLTGLRDSSRKMKLQLLSPDDGTGAPADLNIRGAIVEFRLPVLKTYAVTVIE